jgi:hypothetical protein
LKTVSLDSPQFTLEGALREAADGVVVFLTTGGRTRFALVAVDEGDEEILALRSNADFMGYLDESKLRARQGPSRSLEEIRSRLSGKDSATELKSDPPANREGITR